MLISFAPLEVTCNNDPKWPGRVETVLKVCDLIYQTIEKETKHKMSSPCGVDTARTSVYSTVCTFCQSHMLPHDNFSSLQSVWCLAKSFISLDSYYLSFTHMSSKNELLFVFIGRMRFLRRPRRRQMCSIGLKIQLFRVRAMLGCTWLRSWCLL